MIKKLVILLAFLLITSPSFALTKQVITGRQNTSSSASATQYLPPMCGGTQCTYQTTRALAEGPWPTAATISNFCIELTTAPANGAGTQSYVYTIYVNGSATALVLTFEETDAPMECDNVNTASITAGQPLTIETVPSGTPAVTGVKYSYTSTSTTAGESVFVWAPGSTNMNAAQNNRRIFPGGSAVWQVADDARFMSPTTGTIKNLYGVLSADPDNGAGVDSYIITVNENGSASSMTFTAADGQTSGSDLVNTIAAIPGDTYSINQISTGSPTATTLGGSILFLSAVDGEFPVPGNFAVNTTSSVYGSLGWSSSSTTETGRDSLAGTTFTAKNIYVGLSAAVDADGSVVLTLREETITSTAETCTVGSAAQTCNATTDVTVTSGNTYDTLSAPSTTPGTPQIWVAYLGFIQPAATSTAIQAATFQGVTIN